MSNIHFFNPGYEASVRAGLRYYTPPKMVKRLRADLQTLPIYIAKEGEKVMIHHPIPEQWRHSRFVTNFSEGDSLLPWGWGPELIGLFGTSAVPYSEDEMIYFTSRARGIELWHAVYESAPSSFVYSPPQVVTPSLSIEEGSWVLKEDFTSSGRGISFISNQSELTTHLLKSPSQYYIEPYYEILKELGFEFHCKEGQVTYLGCHQAITKQTQYVGSLLTLSLEAGVDIEGYAELVRRALPGLLLMRYEGVVGVDTALYRDQDGALRFVPCLEVNVRPTMGFVALCLERQYLCGRRGRFLIVRRDNPLLEQVSSEVPLYLQPYSCLEPGTYLLNPLLSDTYFIALLEIYY